MNKAKNMIQQARKLILVAVFAMATMIAFTQTGGPPPPPDGSNDGTNHIGANANIGGGVLILLALGLAYGGKRLYDLRKEKKEEIV